MDKIVVFPPLPVVHVPITLFHSNKQPIDLKNIIECNWYVDDELVQSLKDNLPTAKRISTTSLLSLMTSGTQSPLLTYVPKPSDANKQLKVICKFRSKFLRIIPDTSVFQFEHQIKSSKSNSLRDLHLIPGDNNSSSNISSNQNQVNQANGSSYRIVQYNILADCYTNQFMYPYCERYAIHYQYYRKYLIGKQILQYNPDIVCLQEVEDSYLDLFREMEDSGYLRSPQFPTKNSTPGVASEGCVVFYRDSRFKLISHVLLKYSKINRESCQAEDAFITLDQYEFLYKEPLFVKILESVMPMNGHHNKHVLMLLEDKETGKKLVAISVHAFWGSLANMELNFQFQCLQMIILTMTLDNLLKRNNLNPKETGIVLCGDFNNGPDGEAYGLLANGYFCKEDTKFTIPYKSDYKYTSVYTRLPFGEPSFTFYTKNGQQNLDQIWINDQFNIHSILDIGDKSLYNEYSYLPSPVLGSDHILLMSDIKFKQ